MFCHGRHNPVPPQSRGCRVENPAETGGCRSLECMSSSIRVITACPILSDRVFSRPGHFLSSAKFASRRSGKLLSSEVMLCTAYFALGTVYSALCTLHSVPSSFLPISLSPFLPLSPRPYSGEGPGVRAVSLVFLPSSFCLSFPFRVFVYFVVFVLRGHFSEQRGSQYLVWTEKRRSPDKSMRFSWSTTCRSVFALPRKLFFSNHRFRPRNAMLSTPLMIEQSNGKHCG